MSSVSVVLMSASVMFWFLSDSTMSMLDAHVWLSVMRYSASIVFVFW